MTEKRLKTMKREITAMFFALALAAPLLAAHQPVDANTLWKNVPPTNKVADVINSVSKTNVTMAISDGMLTILTNGVPVWSSSQSAAKRVAMFIIQIPSNQTINNVYTGFELKASTNNFGALPPLGGDRLQYYGNSYLGMSPIESGMDKMRLFMCKPNDTADNFDMRTYAPIQSTVDGEYYTHVVALVDATCLLRHPDGDWLRSDNKDLIWVYNRTKINDYEKDADGYKVWHPVSPAAWFDSLPAWALTPHPIW